MLNIEPLPASGSYNSNFQHSPLDYNQPAIRVLRIRPYLSAEGYLQCSLTSTTTKDDYTCLSYTWGREDAVCPILLNWRLFLVRRNLMNFLEVARKKYPGQALWIDAICIDQHSVIERNHQVAQMGAIYTAAKHVIIWLGGSRPIARFFEVWKQCNMIKSTSNWWIEVAKSLVEVEYGWRLLTQHEYWTRAWITQEIARANSLSVLAMDVELDRSLLKYIGKIPLYTHDGLDSRFTRHIDLARGRRLLHDRSLFSILQELPNQHCHIRRDRIYSLLALASEGANIPVDYERTHLDIGVDIMRACSESACICSFGLIKRVLGIPSTNNDLKAEPLDYFAEVTVQACQLVNISEVTDRPEYECKHCGWKSYLQKTEGPYNGILWVDSLSRDSNQLRALTGSP
ncbi:heterokaryon incompatibility protein-domain-containing protein [Alternaria rosae]|uniref:heterokaryon incompatibility protein-domain-containing protein n=1 Tax=Alternaria rosae TaxID=1187941 RepID=UPI001E8CF906|nr:heterokaryon incompatibility protein-domain-containing protein [Alternaria rosae]KAH6861032.1 heterokaryon incompatibility protein-domain-containing protein [Alternaria rosae]